MSSDETAIHSDGGSNALEAMAQLERELVDQAVTSGLITSAQADDLTDSFERLVVGQHASDCDAADQTVAYMVEKGLVSAEAGEQLKQKVVGEFLPGYTLQSELGRGAMGVVYKAIQQKLDRPVALKVINPKLSADRSYVDRFKREALTLAKLNHPNIVQVYDYGEEGNKIFLALELVKGRDCSEIIKERGTLEEAEALRIIRDAALGLSHAHQHGIVHRDVKPANMMVLESLADAAAGGSVTKVMDLGLAREAEPKAGQAELTQAGTILGSPAYMAPEQTEGKVADFRSDVYALGASLYHMLTGAIPFQSSSVIDVLVKKRTETLPNPKEKRPDLSEGLVRVLDRMLARKPEERYATYEQLLTDLEALLAGQLPKTGPVPREASSLRLTGRLAKASGGSLSTLQQEQRGEAPPEPGGPGGMIALLVVLALFVGAGLLWKSEPSTTRDGGGTANAGTPPIDGPGTGGAPTDDTLANLDATAEDALNEAQGLHNSGDYAALEKLTGDRIALYELASKDVPDELRSLAEVARAATRDGLGLQEREVWEKAQASADPLERQELLKEFRARFGTFSPVVEEAERLYAEAEALTPRVSLRTVPARASLSVDGEQVPAGDRWTGVLTQGEHVVRADAKGFRPLLTTIRVEGPTQRTLHLAPLPRTPLRQDPLRQRPVWRADAFFEQWRSTGSWEPVPAQAGVLGEADGTASTTVRDLSQEVGRRPLRGLPGWSLQWELLPHPKQNDSKTWESAPTPEELGSFEAEVRLLAGEGAAVAFGVRGRTVYAGVRRGEELDVRCEEAGDGLPRNYRVDYDGDVLTLYTGQAVLWSIRPDWKPEGARAEFTVTRGRALYQNFELIGLVPAK